MAYGKKYFLNFNDFSGNTYVVNLLKKDYSGSSSEIERFPVSPVTHTYRGGRDNINDVISGSEVNLNFYVTPSDNDRYDEIFESDYKDWQLEILKTGLVSDGYGYDSTVQSLNLTEDNSNDGKLWSVTDGTGANIITGLFMTHTGNNYTLHWTNPSFNFTPQSFYIIVETFSDVNPFEPDVKINGNNLSSYTFVGMGEYPFDVYNFSVAPCLNLNGINPLEFSETLIYTGVTNSNTPLNFEAVDSGSNSVLLTWDNPAYSFTVQSFSFNRLRYVAPNWTDNHTINFNNDGSATSFYDTTLGITGLYRYQMQACSLPDGFGGASSTFPLIEVSYTSHAIPPTLSLNNNSGTTYYGGAFVTPSLHIVGGDTDVTLNYHVSNDSPSVVGSAINKTQLITVNGSTYNVNLETNANAIRGGAFHVTLDTDATYNLGSPITKTFNVPALTNSGKVEGTSLSGGAGTNVSITWTAYSDSNSLTGWGYLIGRYLTSNPSSVTTFLVSGMATTSYTDTTSSSLTYGNYTYYVRAINVSNILSIANASVYISPTYPDMVPINISAAPTVPSAPSLNCNSIRTTTTAQLTWVPVGGATGYKLWVQDAFSAAIIYNDTNVGNVTSYNVTLSPTNGYNFYFKVRAYNAVGDGSYSSTYGFVVQPPAPNTPTMTSRTSSQIAIDWNDVAFIGTYRVQRATNSSFTTGLVESSDLVNSNYTITGLSSATTYYIRVKAITFVDSPCGGQVDSNWSGTLTQATS